MLLLSSAIANVYASRYSRRTLDMRGIEILGPGVDMKINGINLLSYEALSFKAFLDIMSTHGLSVPPRS